MDETPNMESHLSSAAAFVEGGVQEACDDACSICLEAFCDSDPSTVTGCKHEFHLQCILEWCQRSSQCPMCCQPISLKDPTSQELLEAVEHERSFRFNQSRNTTIFHHPTLGDFELQHLPVGTSDVELEERIIQHLAAAAAMGRARHMSRREGHRRSGAHGRPQFLVFSAHPGAPAVGPVSALDQIGENYPPPVNALGGSSVPLHAGGEEALHQVPHVSSPETQVPSSGFSEVTSASRPGHSNNQNFAAQSSPINQDRGGPSDFQSFSESFKSRFNAVSMRCKESITKSTRGWKERFFSRNSPVADLGSEVRREVQAGIATVSRMMERLDSRENRATGPSLRSAEGHSGMETRNLRIVAGQTEETPNAINPSASCAASSGSN